MDALNTGVVFVEAGFCIVFSESRKWYFLLRRDDKELEALAALPSELFRSATAWGCSTNVAPARDSAMTGPGAAELQAARAVEMQGISGPGGPITPKSVSLPLKPLPIPTRSVKTEMPKKVEGPSRLATARKVWSADRCAFIGMEGCGLEPLLDGEAEVLFLGKARWTSATMAVIALSAGSLVAEGGFCVVFSRARRTYNLIWRSDKDSELARLFPTLPAQPATAALEAAQQPSHRDELRKQAGLSSPRRSPSASCLMTSMPQPVALAASSRGHSLSEHAVVATVEDSAEQAVALGATPTHDAALFPNRLGAPCRRFSAPPTSLFGQLDVLTLETPREVTQAHEAPERVVGDNLPSHRGLPPPLPMPSPIPVESSAPADPEAEQADLGTPSRRFSAPPAALVQRKAPRESSVPEPAQVDLGLPFQRSRSHPTVLATVDALQEQAARCVVGPSHGARGIEVSELHFVGEFDMNQSSVQAQIFSILELSPDSSVQQLDQVGGLNVGVWTVQDGACESTRRLVLKLVQADRQEGECFVRLAREKPALMLDPTLAFPVKIIHCLSPGAAKQYDLIVMPEVSGSNLSLIIGNMWYGQQAATLMQLIRKIGTCLAEFHQKHDNNQHGDFQPSNVFYDEADGSMTFIDLVGIGPEGACLDNDVEHFMQSLSLMSRAYGPTFLEDAQQHFQSGYAECSRSKM